MVLGVAIVEDDAKFRDAFAQFVRGAADMRLLGTAANGRQGYALLDAHAPDVLLIDLDLPDIRGLEVIRRCVERHPDCDIMVVTVFGDERHVLESIEAGATGYLLKDSLPADLLEQIRLLRAGGSPISPIIARQLLARFQVPVSATPDLAATPGVAVAPPPVPEPPAGVPDEVAGRELSERERTVLGLVAKGFTYDEIAGLIGVSRHTVMTYVKRIYRKLQVGSKTEAVYEARKMGLVRD